jgi:dethiobiotin synthetase
MTDRVYIVGTDTGVGKTAVTCALLHHLRARGVSVLPFKPVASGPQGPDADPARLLRAAALSASHLEAICPLRYTDPVAPGLADQPSQFLGQPAPTRAFLDRARAALTDLEHQLRPDLVLIEGAGGLFVPMPGGIWQPDWIRALTTRVLLVARAELGTINHTCLTTDALRALGFSLLGFIFSETSASSDPSRTDNAAVLSHARQLVHLGTLPHQPNPDAPSDPAWVSSSICQVLCSQPSTASAEITDS